MSSPHHQPSLRITRIGWLWSLSLFFFILAFNSKSVSSSTSYEICQKLRNRTTSIRVINVVGSQLILITTSGHMLKTNIDNMEKILPPAPKDKDSQEIKPTYRLTVKDAQLSHVSNLWPHQENFIDFSTEDHVYYLVNGRRRQSYLALLKYTPTNHPIRTKRLEHYALSLQDYKLNPAYSLNATYEVAHVEFVLSDTDVFRGFVFHGHFNDKYQFNHGYRFCQFSFYTISDIWLMNQLDVDIPKGKEHFYLCHNFTFAKAPQSGFYYRKHDVIFYFFLDGTVWQKTEPDFGVVNLIWQGTQVMQIDEFLICIEESFWFVYAIRSVLVILGLLLIVAGAVYKKNVMDFIKSKIFKKDSFASEESAMDAEGGGSSAADSSPQSDAKPKAVVKPVKKIRPKKSKVKSSHKSKAQSSVPPSEVASSTTPTTQSQSQDHGQDQGQDQGQNQSKNQSNLSSNASSNNNNSEAKSSMIGRLSKSREKVSSFLGTLKKGLSRLISKKSKKKKKKKKEAAKKDTKADKTSDIEETNSSK